MKNAFLAGLFNICGVFHHAGNGRAFSDTSDTDWRFTASITHLDSDRGEHRLAHRKLAHDSLIKMNSGGAITHLFTNSSIVGETGTCPLHIAPTGPQSLALASRTRAAATAGEANNVTQPLPRTHPPLMGVGGAENNQGKSINPPTALKLNSNAFITPPCDSHRYATGEAAKALNFSAQMCQALL